MTHHPEDDEQKPPVDDEATSEATPGEGEPQVRGGRAAERLREHLRARFGAEAPPVPPDEREFSEDDDSQDSDEDEDPT